jgi:membrane dipeptidase
MSSHRFDPPVLSTYGGPLNADVGFKRSWSGRKHVLVTDHLPNFRAGGLAGLVLPVDSIDDIAMFLMEIHESEHRVVLAEKGTDLQEATEQGVFVVVFCANYASIGDDLSSIPLLRHLGVRFLSLSTNLRNLLADGCGERTPSGLSHLGVSVVRELGNWGIFPDVSHLSEQGFWDVVEQASVPIVATHSNARNLCNTDRNLDDAQLGAIADSGGLVGVSTYPTLIAEEDASLEDLLDHIDYLVEHIGVEHVGIGTDFVSFMGSLIDAKLSNIDPNGKLYKGLGATTLTKGIGCFSEVANLVDGLTARGYADEDLSMILGGNLIRLLG